MTPTYAYFDSSIIISYLLGSKDRFYNQVKYIFEKKIKNKEMIGLISKLTLLETIDVIKRRIVERTDKSILDEFTDEERKSYLKSIIDEKIKDFIDILTRMEHKKYIVLADFTMVDLKQIINEAYNYSLKYFGDIKRYSRCMICRNNYEHYSYKGLGWIDFTHILLAINLAADEFITADKSFKDLKNDPEFRDIEIKIIS